MVEILWRAKGGDVIVVIKAKDENEAILKRANLDKVIWEKGEPIIGLDWW